MRALRFPKGRGPDGRDASPPRDAGTASRSVAGRDIFDQLVFRVVNLALGIVASIALVRGLGDAGFGQWSTIFAVIGLAGSFGLQGLNNVAIERATAEPERSSWWVGSLVTLRVVLSPPLTLASLAICLVVANGREMQLAALIIHVVFLTSALATARIVFQLKVKNAFVSAFELVSSVVWTAAVGLVVLLGGGLIAMALAFTLVTSLSNVVMWWLSVREHPIKARGSRRHWGELLRRGLPVAMASMLTMGYARIDQIIVFQIGGESQAGLYGAAYRIFERLQIFPGTLLTTLFPILVAAKAEGTERMRTVFNTTIDYLVLVSLPAFTIILAGPTEIAVLLFGSDFAESGEALPILAAALVVVSLGYLTGYLIITYDLQRPFVAVAVAALVFNVSANLVLVPRYGFVAAAWITLATEVIVLSTSMLLLSRRMGVRPTGVRLLRIGLAAAAAGLVAWVLRIVGLPTLAWAFLGGVTYLGALLAFRAVKTADVRTTLLRRGSR